MLRINRPTVRVTREILGSGFGADAHRPLVVATAPGDRLVFRPLGTRRPETVDIRDVYRWLVQHRAEQERISKKKPRES